MSSVTSVQVFWPNKPGVLRTWLFPVGQSVSEGTQLADCEPRGLELRSPITGQILKLNKRNGDKVNASYDFKHGL